MNLLKFISIKLVLFLVVGILLGRLLNLPLFPLLIITLLSTTVFAIIWYIFRKNNSAWFGVLFYVTTTLIGVFSFSLAQPKNISTHYTHSITQPSNILHVKIKEVLKPNRYYNRYIATVDKVGTKKSTGDILLYTAFSSSKKELIVDDETHLNNQLSPIKTPLNPHQFNYADYMDGLGIYHQINVSEINYIQKKTSTTSIYGLAYTVRNHIILKLKNTNFGDEELGVIQALLLGQRNNISEKTYTDYKNAGAVHILALSGLHIGIILLLVQFMLKPLERLPKGKNIKLITTLIIIWSFAFLAGFSASIIRATTMFSFVAYALHLKRPANMFNILAVSMFFILLFKPMLLFQVGFQMSYAAVFSIVWIYPLLQKFWFPKSWLLQKIWQLFSVSLAAQLGVLPISLFYFHQFPGLFFISNLVIIPFLGIIIGMGILIIFLSLFNALPYFIALAYNYLIQSMNNIIAWVSQQEAFIFRNITFDAFQLLISYIIIISLVLLLTKISFKRLIVLCLGILCFQSWNIYQIYHHNQTKKLMVMHKTKNTILLSQKGRTINVLTNDSSQLKSLLNNYKIAERIKETSFTPLNNSYNFGNNTLLIVDSLGVYPNLEKTNSIVLLSQSPKLNLDRLIATIKPKAIIADGSNYKNYIERWKNTCSKRKLPFHYTSEKGAYYFNIKE